MPDKLTTDGDKFLTTEEVAELLQVCPRTIERWVKRGLLPVLKIGSLVRYRMEDVINHLNKKCRVVRRAA